MSIRTDDPISNPLATTLLVEDAGLCKFLPTVLNITSISDAERDVHVIGGGGWTEVYRKYDELVNSGADAAQIISVLDADTLRREKGNISKVHNNPNIFRFYFDLEMEFSQWECMLLDHALLLLLPGAFGNYGEIEALRTWTNIVDQARTQTVQQNDNHTTYDNVEMVAKRELGNRNNPNYPLEGLRMPSKVRLAEILAELCVATGTLPPELVKLLLKIEAKANNRLAYDANQYRHQYHPLWISPLASLLPQCAPALEGRVLFSPNGVGLKFVDLAAGGTIQAIPGADDLGWGAWLPDGRIIATMAHSDGVVITTVENAQERLVIRQGVRESFLCWYEKSRRVLLRDQNEQVFMVSEDNRSWSKISAPGYSHCLSANECLAWVTRDYETIYVRPLQNQKVDPLSITGVIDGRHSLAWSHSGKEIAFVNAERNDSRRTICIWNRKTKETRFIVPWIGKPIHLAWSPDDKYLIFQLKDADGLFIVQTQPEGNHMISPLLRVAVEGGVLKCGAWHK